MPNVKRLIICQRVFVQTDTLAIHLLDVKFNATNQQHKLPLMCVDQVRVDQMPSAMKSIVSLYALVIQNFRARRQIVVLNVQSMLNVHKIKRVIILNVKIHALEHVALMRVNNKYSFDITPQKKNSKTPY